MNTHPAQTRRPSPPPGAPRPRRRAGRSGGFTLIEAALATVIVGTGVLAIVAAQQAYHRKNDWAQRSGTAMLLANEIRELTLTMPAHNPLNPTVMGSSAGQSASTFSVVDNFAGVINGAGIGAGVTISPPINALKQPVVLYSTTTDPNASMGRWSQFVNVQSVLPGNIAGSTFALGSTGLMRVTVTIYYQDATLPAPEALTTLTWIIPG